MKNIYKIAIPISKFKSDSGKSNISEIVYSCPQWNFSNPLENKSADPIKAGPL